MVSWRRVHGCAGAHQSLSCKRPVSLSTEAEVYRLERPGCNGVPTRRLGHLRACAATGEGGENCQPVTMHVILIHFVYSGMIQWYIVICHDMWWEYSKYMSQISHSRINGPFPTGSRRGSTFLEWLDGIILGAHFPYVVSACFYPLAIGKPSICRWHTIRM